MDEIREPSVSGTFYPRNADVLRADIETFLGKVPPANIPGDIRGLISPHAGYMYSGQTAAYGYKALAGRHYDTVVIVAPSHHSFFIGAAAQDKGAYKTPLGTVEVDTELAQDLVKAGGAVHADPKVHRGEHSIEVQIPFLQCVLRDFRIVPLIMGSAQDADGSLELGALLHDTLRNRKGDYLVIGSTDLSHYYPYGLAVTMDKAAIDLIERFDLKGLAAGLARGKYEACGAGAIFATMSVCERLGAGQSKVLNYANSGDVTGEMSGVVGYVSCVFYGGK
ncbi:MAG: AmmeMemoRadiSam system protein B [Syntrophorhabdales bacterium]|jgi:AmmeMemoRadiSam system protein B